MLTSPKIVIVSVTMVLILSSVVFAPVRGKDITLNWTTDAPTSGSGTAGSGSIAVSAFFDTSSFSGVGGLSGSLTSSALGGPYNVEGVFQLSTSPALLPVLPCGPLGEIGASGAMITGKFQGDPVTVFGCVGNSVPGGIQIVDRLDPYKNFAYSGSGTGDGSMSQSVLLAGMIQAGNTQGAGSAGTGALQITTVEVVRESGFFGGGAFVGTLNAAVPVSGTIMTKTASVGNGCEVNLSGVVSSGLFSGQPEATSFVPATCPPTFLQQGRLLLDGVVVFTIGTPTSIPYFGKGTGQLLVLWGSR